MDGVDHWLSAWSKISKSGEKYLSIAVNEKESGNSQQVGRGTLEMNSRKSEDNHPDMTGTVKIGTDIYELGVWFNTQKGNKEKYLSITISEGNGRFDENAEEMPWEF